MLVPVQINSDDLINQYNLSKEDVENIINYTIKEITGQFAIAWEEQAKLDLKSTRSRYIQNLKVVDEGRMMGAVILDYSKDPLIKMIEEGCSAFDMKDGFEKSSKKKTVYRKDGTIGWYLTIPLKAGNPEATETSGFANILPTQVYNIVKKEVVSPLTGRSKGLNDEDIPSPYNIPQVRAAIVIPESQAFKEYQHKSSIYQGLFKQTDKITGQNSYASFRRVSDKSDQMSFIFPGLNAMNLAEKAMSKFENNMQTVLETSMDNALSYFGL